MPMNVKKVKIGLDPANKASNPQSSTAKQPKIPKKKHSSNSSSTLRLPECDYDTSPTSLYQAIQARQWETVLSLLLTFDESPAIQQEIRTWVVRKEPNGKLRWRLLPLHAAIIFQAPFGVVEQLILHFPAATNCKDDQGMLPLHLVLRNHPLEWRVLEELVTAHPAAVFVKDRKGRTPLQGGVAAVSALARKMQQKQKAENSDADKNGADSADTPWGKHQAALNVLDLYTSVLVAGEKSKWTKQHQQLQLQQSYTGGSSVDGSVNAPADWQQRLSSLAQQHAVRLTELRDEFEAEQSVKDEQYAQQLQDWQQQIQSLQQQLHSTQTELLQAQHSLQTHRSQSITAHGQTRQHLQTLTQETLQWRQRLESTVSYLEQLAATTNSEQAALSDWHTRNEELWSQYRASVSARQHRQKESWTEWQQQLMQQSQETRDLLAAAEAQRPEQWLWEHADHLSRQEEGQKRSINKAESESPANRAVTLATGVVGDSLTLTTPSLASPMELPSIMAPPPPPPPPTLPPIKNGNIMKEEEKKEEMLHEQQQLSIDQSTKETQAESEPVVEMERELSPIARMKAMREQEKSLAVQAAVEHDLYQPTLEVELTLSDLPLMNADSETIQEEEEVGVNDPKTKPGEPEPYVDPSEETSRTIMETVVHDQSLDTILEANTQEGVLSVDSEAKEEQADGTTEEFVKQTDEIVTTLPVDNNMAEKAEEPQKEAEKEKHPPTMKETTDTDIEYDSDSDGVAGAIQVATLEVLSEDEPKRGVSKDISEIDSNEEAEGATDEVEEAVEEERKESSDVVEKPEVDENQTGKTEEDSLLEAEAMKNVIAAVGASDDEDQEREGLQETEPDRQEEPMAEAQTAYSGELEEAVTEEVEFETDPGDEDEESENEDDSDYETDDDDKEDAGNVRSLDIDLVSTPILKYGIGNEVALSPISTPEEVAARIQAQRAAGATTWSSVRMGEVRHHQ